jgi:putative transcriptional regulator
VLPGFSSVYRASAIALLLAGTAAAQSKNPESLRNATLLVASRDLDDPNFAQTVILLVHYDDDGVLGLIVNSRTDVPISRAFEGIKAAKSRTDAVYLGGPVGPSTVFALRQSKDEIEGAERIFGDVHFISNKAALEKNFAARPGPADFHVYLGYAGWTNAQLRTEVELGAWYIFRADAAAIFDADPDSLWSRMIRRSEQKLAGPLLKGPVSLAGLQR